MNKNKFYPLGFCSSSLLASSLLAIILLAGCGSAEPSSTGVDATRDSSAAEQKQAVVVQNDKSTPLAKPAPDFTLPNLDGVSVSLSSYRGNIVVLEWFNPECPFVNLAHSRELSLKGMASKWSDQGIKWLGINSGAAGMQGHGKVASQRGVQALGVSNPILLDEDGQVGQAYGATHTPQIVIIDASGNIVYNGAIDNTRGGDVDDATPGPAANFVTPILTKLVANKSVSYQKTKPWGCTVKYAK